LRERKRRAAEERKGRSDAANLASNYDIEQALLFIGAENETSKRSCLRRGAGKYGEKKKPCRNRQKEERIINIESDDTDDESVKAEEVSNSWTIEDEENFVELCHSKTDEEWTEVNVRKRNKTSKKQEKMPSHLFTIEDLSHSVCHGTITPFDDPRCEMAEKLVKAEAWETCLFSAEDSGKLLSEEDFPSLQSCGWRRKERKVVEEEVRVVEDEKVVEEEEEEDLDSTEHKVDAEEEKKDVEHDEEEDEDEEEPEKFEHLARSCCLRDMFHFPGTLCFCFCDSEKISTAPNSVVDEEEPKIEMTRMHAMLRGLVVPFGKL